MELREKRQKFKSESVYTEPNKSVPPGQMVGGPTR
jgi:hypothetical protein